MLMPCGKRNICLCWIGDEAECRRENHKRWPRFVCQDNYHWGPDALRINLSGGRGSLSNWFHSSLHASFLRVYFRRLKLNKLICNPSQTCRKPTSKKVQFCNAKFRMWIAVTPSDELCLFQNLNITSADAGLSLRMPQVLMDPVPAQQ